MKVRTPSFHFKQLIVFFYKLIRQNSYKEISTKVFQKLNFLMQDKAIPLIQNNGIKF